MTTKGGSFLALKADGTQLAEKCRDVMDPVPSENHHITVFSDGNKPFTADDIDAHLWCLVGKTVYHAVELKCLTGCEGEDNIVTAILRPASEHSICPILGIVHDMETRGWRHNARRHIGDLVDPMIHLTLGVLKPGASLDKVKTDVEGMVVDIQWEDPPNVVPFVIG